ncbi:MAG: endonuclease [Bacteroidales bacterium]|nr:endonuclease [Bacteroidales bacterium]MCF8333752.1 endonuclease [Bacteroidales bacterium]
MIKKSFLTLLTTMLLAVIAVGQIPDGYYDGTEGLSGEELKQELHDIIDDHEEYSYDDLRDFILENTDEDPDNPDNVILLYTGRSQPKSTFGGGADDWNREHVWAKSHGDFGNTPPAGTDAHHIRPTDASVNSSRGNLDFDNGGQQHDEATGCYFDDDSWEPRDEVKGDVARMILYMEIRYEGSGSQVDLEVVDEVDTYPTPEHGKLSTLLEWHQQDPPDDFEINRNEVVYGYQGNRNPFIDHPGFVGMIWEPSTGIDDVKSHQLDAWPNPVRDRLTVQLPEKMDKTAEPQMFNVLGETLSIPYQKKGDEALFDVSGIREGYYVIRFIDRSTQQYSVKFLKQ